MVFHHSGGNECKLCSSHCGLSVSEHTSDVCGRSSANAPNMLEWDAVAIHCIVSLFDSMQWQSPFYHYMEGGGEGGCSLQHHSTTARQVCH